MGFIRTAVAAWVGMLAASFAAAQTGGITVVVTDSEGRPLPGAIVTISNETGYVKTTSEMANGQGLVDFPVLRPGGGYSIEVSFPGGGFAAVRRHDLRVRMSQTTNIRITLLEEFQERVKITAQSDVIDLNKSEASTRFSDAFIGDLPVPGRFYQNVLTMAPGVQDADGDGNPNVHGSRSRDFQAVVSGVSNVDPLTGQWMSRINPNSIEEMEVITAGAGVEFGRAQGGFARIVQKQGSNRHEGVFEFYWQTSKLDGDGAGDFSNLPDTKFDTVQPLFQFSGPIARDKLWYRVSYERRDREEPINVLSGIEVYTRDTETRDAQVTWQISPRNKLALQYRSDPVKQANLGVSNVRPAESALANDRGVTGWTLNWTAPYSTKVLVETTLGWTDVNEAYGPHERGRENACVPHADRAFLREALCNDLTRNTFSGSFNQALNDHRQRLTVKGQATVFGGRMWGMSHQFKLGVSVENERYFRDLEFRPLMTYQIVEVFDDDVPEEEQAAEAFGSALVRLAIPERDNVRATGTNWSLYAEDQLKPTRSLTLTVGARMDREEIASEGRVPFDATAELQAYEDLLTTAKNSQELVLLQQQWPSYFTGYENFAGFEAELQDILCEGVGPEGVGNCLTKVSESISAQAHNELAAHNNLRRSSNIELNNTNVSPFLSLAWAPFSNGKTAVKAAVGRHYNNIPLVIPIQELEPVVTDLDYRVSLIDPAACDDQPENPEAEVPCGGAKIYRGVSPAINLSTVDRSLETPYQDEVSLRVERELWSETSVSFQYLNRKYRDQLQDVNINLETGDYGRCSLQLTPSDLPVVAAPGASASFEEDLGDWLHDPYTGRSYPDTDPGIGDGILDDCAGDPDFILGGDSGLCDGPFCDNAFNVHRPDGITDLYVQNPFWGDIFLIGNFNEHEYEAFIVELVRRQYRSWEMNASYTWSKAQGNGEDFEQILGDDPSLRDDLVGYQSYDQRHVVKFNATTVTPWGVRLGTSVTWQSGLPYSLLTERVSVDELAPSTDVIGVLPSRRRRQIYNTGVRNDQRNDSYWNVDLKATRELRLSKGLSLQLSAEIFNLLDDGTYQIYNPFFERGQQVNGVNEAQRRFGRRWQVGMRVAF